MNMQRFEAYLTNNNFLKDCSMKKALKYFIHHYNIYSSTLCLDDESSLIFTI